MTSRIRCLVKVLQYSIERILMSEVMRLKRVFAFFVLFVCFNSLIANAGQLDKSRYIGIDEIKRGMKGYCLTVYEGTKIEKFELDVVDVVLDYRPGRNAIMVIGTDERFIHSGTVHGCSGSPVFIDGRLAGALAFGWDGAKDPLYGVTPIGEMLVAGEVVNYETMDKGGFGFDYSRPVDFGRAYKKILGGVRVSEPEFAGGMKKLSCPLFVSGLPEEVMGDFGRQMRGLGFEAIAGSGVGSKIEQGGEVKLERGSSLAVPLVTGDISMAVMGTVTEVVGDKVYGFGHSFMGYGAVNFPMATGTIHTVVSHLFGSFKFGSPLEVVGTLTADEATAVYGRVGVEPEMIELVIKVDRYNDSEVRVYNCQIANNEIYTPMILGAAVSGAGLMKGSLPPDNSVEYSVVIDVEGFEPIRYENISTIVGLGEMVSESSSAVAMLMSNPYRRLKIKRLEFDFRIEAKDIASRIWSVNVSDGSVKPGQQVDVTVVTEKYLGAKRKFEYR
ncbi:MAG: hypothetical protein ISS77_08070, partial [Phycisphaerae bacterium]|nr:hypothetical protein [Phycisphaerae bacterium]